MKKKSYHPHLSDNEIDWLRKQVRERGEAAVAGELKMSGQTIRSLLSGLTVMPSTAQLFRQYMGSPKVSL